MTEKKSIGVAPETDGDVLTVNDLTAFPQITGTSGRVYQAVNLLTEMTTRHKNAIREAIQPALPALVQMVTIGLEAMSRGETAAVLDRNNVMDALRRANPAQAFQAVAMEGLVLRLVALLYLPLDDRVFHDHPVVGLVFEGDAGRAPTEVDVRMDDLADVSTDVLFEAVKRFFTSSFAFSQSTFLAFCLEVLRKRPARLIRRDFET